MLARFAVVGALVTAVDVAVFLLVWSGGDRSPVLADLGAVVLASALSFPAHRAVTFRGDPYRRWLEHHLSFAVAAVAGGAVDLAVAVSVLETTASTSIEGGTAAKLAAVGVAGAVRWALHRRVLFHIVRDEHVARPDRRPAPGALRVSVVLPAYREGAGIAECVGRVRAALAGLEGGSEIVVVDDGSPDATAAQARRAGADAVVVLAENRGKGAAVRAGAGAARGRTIVFTDADLAYDPAQVVTLVGAVEEGWDLVVGSRRLAGSTTDVPARRVRALGGRLINGLTRAVVLGHYRDTQCGLKALRADVAGSLFGRCRIDGFAFDIELFVIAERDRLALREVPVRVTNTTASTVHVARDGVRLVRDLFRIRRWARQGHYQREPAGVATPAADETGRGRARH